MQMYDLNEIEERVILVGVQVNDGEDTEESLDELEELAETAGARTGKPFTREPTLERER